MRRHDAASGGFKSLFSRNMSAFLRPASASCPPPPSLPSPSTFLPSSLSPCIRLKLKLIQQENSVFLHTPLRRTQIGWFVDCGSQSAVTLLSLAPCAPRTAPAAAPAAPPTRYSPSSSSHPCTALPPSHASTAVSYILRHRSHPHTPPGCVVSVRVPPDRTAPPAPPVWTALWVAVVAPVQTLRVQYRFAGDDCHG